MALLALAFLSWHHLLPASLASPSCTLRTLTNPSLPLVGSVWQDFIEEIVLPLFSAVGTMTSLDVWSTPVQCLLEYIHTTVGTAHYTLGKGFTAQRVAERLVNPIFEQGAEYLRLGADVTGLQYRDGAVVVRLGVEEIEVDRVVIATQASAASGLLSMLEDTLLITGEKEEFRRVKGMTKALGEVEYRVSTPGWLRCCVYPCAIRRQSSSRIAIGVFSLPKPIAAISTYTFRPFPRPLRQRTRLSSGPVIQSLDPRHPPPSDACLTSSHATMRSTRWRRISYVRLLHFEEEVLRMYCKRPIPSSALMLRRSLASRKWKGQCTCALYWRSE